MYSAVSAFLRRVDVATPEQPLFYSRKIRTTRDLRQHFVDRKVPEPCAKGFCNRNISVDLDNFWSIAFRATKETRLHVLHWKYCITFIPPTFYYAK